MESDPPYVHSAELQRWSDTYTPGYAQMTEDDLSVARKSPFTYNPQINAKIAYWLVVIFWCRRSDHIVSSFHECSSVVLITES